MELLTDKEIKSIAKRIKRANTSMNVGGDMLLCMDIDHKWSLWQLEQLQIALAAQNLSYEYLNIKIENLSKRTIVFAK